MIKNFENFLNSIKTDKNATVLECIISGFHSIFESLSTDDANEKPFGSVLKYEEPPALISIKNDKEEYFPKTLSSEKVELVERSKFGLGRIANYPPPGRGIASNDPISNQYGAIQNTEGGSKESSNT